MGAYAVQGDAERLSVSVVDFGAVGDGVADDTRAIQAAFDTQAAHVVIPHGTFLISNTVLPAARQCVEINGTLRVKDAVIRPLARDMAEGDDAVVVVDADQFYVGQRVTLWDEQLPIHLHEWAPPVNGVPSPYGATYQTRRVDAGTAVITEIIGDKIRLDQTSARSYLCLRGGRIATNHTAIHIVHSDVRICGTGQIDGNKANQLDCGPSPLSGIEAEETRAGCGIKVGGEADLSGVIIEDITVSDAMLHNISLGIHNSGQFPDCTVSDSVVRNVTSIRAHDKNIVIGRVRDSMIVGNFASYAEFEDGIVFHQVRDIRDSADRVTVRANHCVGNARSGIHVGANIHDIYLSENLCVDNGFNFGINGDDCTSTGDTAATVGSSRFPIDKQRPNVYLGGRRLVVNGLTVRDTHQVGLAISGEDILVANGLVDNVGRAGLGTSTTGIMVSLGASCDALLYPAIGIEPLLIRRQATYVAQRVRIHGMAVLGFDTPLAVHPRVNELALRDNVFGSGSSGFDIAEEAWSAITLRDNTGLVSRSNGVARLAASNRVTVLHGLCRPADRSRISLTVIAGGRDCDQVWVDTVTDQTFDIVTDRPTGSALVECAWQAEVCS